MVQQSSILYEQQEVDVIMNERETDNRFPPAMLDVGTPEEMSPIQDRVDSSRDLPMVEITRPLQAGEPAEIREPEFREEGQYEID